MIRSILFILVTLLAFNVCAGEPKRPLFVEAADQSLAAPPADQAQIVFLEPINGIQGLFPVGIFEVEGDKRALLATTAAHSKVALLFTPGRHVLMANHSGMIAHFLDVNVEAGKRYYVLLRFIYGKGFQLRPIRATGPSDYSVTNKDFPTWVSGTRFVEQTPAGVEFWEKNQAVVVKSQTKGWTKWLEKPQKERDELTLHPEDSFSP